MRIRTNADAVSDEEFPLAKPIAAAVIAVVIALAWARELFFYF